MNESEERVVLNAPLYAKPGTSQPRRHAPNVKARVAKLPGRSARAERREAEAKAEVKNNQTTVLDRLREARSAQELERDRARGAARKVTVEMRTGRPDMRWNYRTGEYVETWDANGVGWEAR